MMKEREWRLCTLHASGLATRSTGIEPIIRAIEVSTIYAITIVMPSV